MAFVIKKTNTFKWPVKIKIPADGGGYEESQFEVVFNKLPNSEIIKLSKLDGDFQKNFCKGVVAGWSGVLDEEGKEIPFSDKNLEMLFDQMGVGAQIIEQFYKAVSGALSKAAEKN